MATATAIPQSEQAAQNGAPILSSQNVVPLPIPGNPVPPGVAVPVVPPGAAGVMPMPMHPPSASLYVGDLLSDVTEAMLFEVFNQVGPVASIRVCRDAVTRRSLGYAYVNFHNVVDAERGLDTLNYAPIKGRPCRIMWSQRDPGLRKSGLGNIFIKNLDITIDNKALHDTFSAFGNILSCKVVTDEQQGSGSKGYGFVHYDTMEAAQQAIQKVNGMLLNGKKVFVGLHIPRRARESKVDEMKARFTNVFLKNIDEAVTEDELRVHFEAYGQITSLMIARDENGKSRGFGFINFDNHDEAVAAVENMNNKEINGKPLYAGRAQKKGEREEELRRQFEQLKMEKMSKYQGVNLYVKNLDDAIEDEKLRQEFSVFGTITSAKVMRDEKGNSKGFGFVCFSAAEEATKAVTEMNGRMIGTKPIYVALAQKREVRRAQLEMQHAQRSQLRMPGPGVSPNPMYAGSPIFYGPAGLPPHAQRQNFMYPQPMRGPMPRFGAPVPGAPLPPGQQVRPPFQAMPSYPPGSVPRQGVPPNGRQNRRPPMQNGAGLPPQRPMGNGIVPGMPQNGAALGQQQRRGNFKYGPNARNTRDGVPLGAPGMVPGMLPQQMMVGLGPDAPLTAAALASAPVEQQKQILGERLYPLIAFREPELAGKITGMLLEMENEELLMFLDSPDALNSKVDEAVQVWRAHQANVPQKIEGPEALGGAIAVSEE